VYQVAKARHPEHWRGATRNWQQIRVVRLNPDQQVTEISNRKEDILEIKKAA
jgi:hypothetical protein